MAFALFDRVRETSTTTGTGNMSLAGAVGNYRTFSSVFANADTFFYFIVMGAAFESGIGTYNSGANSITRTTVIESSNSNNAVNFGAGTKDIWVGLPGSYSKPLRHIQYSANVISIGANRSTNPLLQLDYSASSVATGAKLTGAAAGGGVAWTVLSSGTDENVSYDAKGAGTLTLQGTATGAIRFGRDAVPVSSDGAALGTSSLMWSDLFLASGGVVNFNNGNYTLTHSSGVLTASGKFITGGNLEVGGTQAIAYLRSSGAFNSTLYFMSSTSTEEATLASLNGGGGLYIGVSGSEAMRISAAVMRPGADNTQSAGTGSFRYTAVYAVNGTIQTSDERRKPWIADSDLGLDFILAVRPIAYRLDTDAEGVRRYGISAQQVLSVLDGRPFAGITLDGSGFHGATLTEFIAPLIKSVHVLNRRIAALERR